MIAVIAGTGWLPIEACRQLLRNKKDFYVISLFPEDNNEELHSLLGDAHDIITLPFYKVSAVLKTLKLRNTTHSLFIGKVDKRHLFAKVKFDWLFFKLAARVLTRGDKEIMEMLVNYLDEHNIAVLKQSDVLATLFVPPGIVCGSITEQLNTDIALGINLAKKMSSLDVGQTVVIKDGAVMAVEAIEGTDECIARGIALGEKEVVVCKAVNADQNKKYDLPTLGPQSLKTIKPGQIKAIAWQSSHTFIADLPTFIRYARERDITLISVE